MHVCVYVHTYDCTYIYMLKNTCSLLRIHKWKNSPQSAIKIVLKRNSTSIFRITYKTSNTFAFGNCIILHLFLISKILLYRSRDFLSFIFLIFRSDNKFETILPFHTRCLFLASKQYNRSRDKN